MSPAGPRVLALAVVALLASCTTKPPKPERVALEGKAVARVGHSPGRLTADPARAARVC